MDKKNPLLTIGEVAVDIYGTFNPKVAIAKSVFIAGKDLIFKEAVDQTNAKALEKMLEDEKFVHLFLHIQDACRRSKENEKARLFCKFFRTIVDKNEFNRVLSDEIEEFIYTFSTLSFREVLALHKIREVTLSNEKNRVSEGNVYIEDKKVLEEFEDFMKSKLKVNNIEGFLSRLENTGFIRKNRNKLSEERNFYELGSGDQHDGYISTSYFERIYKISNEIEEYLNQCCKHTI